QGISFGGHIGIHMLGLPVKDGPSAAEASDSGASIIDHVSSSAELGEVCMGVWGTPVDVDECRALAERFRHNGTWWVPTLTTMAIMHHGLSFGPRADSALGWATAQVRQLWGDTPPAWFPLSLADAQTSRTNAQSVAALTSASAGAMMAAVQR